MIRAVGDDTAAAGQERARLTIGSGALLGPVLARVVAVYANRADLPLDRLQDALLVTDAIAARAPGYADGGRVGVSVRAWPGLVELRVGPVAAGAAQRLLDEASVPGVGAVVERLTDTVQVRDARAGGEYLVLRLNALAGAE